MEKYTTILMLFTILSCIFPGNRVPRLGQEVSRFSKNTGIPQIFPGNVPTPAKKKILNPSVECFLVVCCNQTIYDRNYLCETVHRSL